MWQQNSLGKWTDMRHKALIFAAVAVLLATPSQAQNSGPPASAPSSISRDGARIIIEAAIAYARDIAKSRMAVVILDNSGHLVSSDRMDGASFHLEKFARGKAFLAIITRRSTQDAVGLAKTRPDRYFGIVAMYPGEVYPVGGGLPIAVDGKLVGAVGIAGLPEGVDEKAALSGLEAFERNWKR
jgi:glc operon protein GlcG